MQSFRFPLAVLGTSLVLVGALALAGTLLARGAFAAGFAGPGAFAGWQAWHGAGGGAWAADLPPELSGLRDIPAADRFAHFRGVQVSLTDKDGKPLTVSVTPGTVTSISSTAVTLNGNDGASHTFGIDSQTKEHGSVALGQKVVVATLNGSQTALAVMSGDTHR
jgi:hypothetical protein